MRSIIKQLLMEPDPSSSDRPFDEIPVWACMCLLALYAAALIWLYIHHVPWRDEAQAWLWALEPLSFFELLVVPGEGHPPLWFWILRGLSGVISFDQARVLMIPLALFNGWLFFKLLGRRGLLLGLCLFSYAFLKFWGFEFRPYTLILTLVLLALLAQRSGRTQIALWLMALTAGLHFFGGFLFGFFVLVQFGRDLRIAPLILPVLLVVCFAALAIWSGTGNPSAGLRSSNLVVGIMRRVAPLLSPLNLVLTPKGTALIVWAAIGFSLRRNLDVLVPLAIVLFGFSIFVHVVYGRADWHHVFMLVLIIMAYFLARPMPSPLFLIVLLGSQVAMTAHHAWGDTMTKKYPGEDVVIAVQASAGDLLEPSHNLIGWPDYLLSVASARQGFHYWSGNSGTLIGPVHWRDRTEIDADLFSTMESPYWLVCKDCALALSVIEGAGRHAVEVQPPLSGTIETVTGYRVED